MELHDLSAQSNNIKMCAFVWDTTIYIYNLMKVLIILLQRNVLIQ